MACIWYDVSHDPALINKRWVAALAVEPVARIVDALKDVDYWLYSQRFNTYGDFKHHLRIQYPGMGQFFAPLSRNISTFYSCGVGLPRIRTALRFATRANFPESFGLEEQAFNEWKAICLSPWETVDVRQESSILREIFPRRKGMIQLDDFIGRFGPGASADAKTTAVADKYLAFADDAMLRYVGTKVDFNPKEMPICSNDTLERVAVIHFAPKQLDKLRTVSMEPASLMFYQLGIQRCMLRLIARSPWRWHIQLDNAELNSDLAWLGSLTGEFATIDLSSASDCVKYSLVKDLFRNTCLREAIIGTRSRYAMYKGQIYQPKYFAPMGSGLCFPIECCVFASVVDAVMRQHDDRRAWRVYGDDIIVPSDRYEDVTARLTQLGFIVNLDKSFSGPPGFRESCGGDYFKGENVRPVYVSRFWEGLIHHSRSSSSLIESNIDLANRLFNYKQARLRVIKSLQTVKPPVLFDSTGEVGIFSVSPTNYHAKSRYNEDLQRDEYRTGMNICRPGKVELEHERIRLFETLRAMEMRGSCEPSDPISISRQRRPIWSGTWRSPSPGWRGAE